MKSIKLASGFAVSALALAIAGQATAEEATAEVEFTGSVKVQGTMDLENDLRFNSAPGLPSNDRDEDWFNLEATWTISNGPFSGDLIVGLTDQDDPRVAVDNLVVEEGPVSFGQVGSVMATDGVLETVTDEDNEGFGFDVDAAARYTVADLGLKVQAEGEANATGIPAPANTPVFGIAAGIEQDLDVATVWADFQYRETANATFDGMEDGETVFGAAVEASPVDMVTLTAAFQNTSVDDGDSAYGVKADVTLADGISVYGQFYDASTETDDSEMIKVGGSAEFAPITVEGNFKSGISEDGPSGGFDAGVVDAKVTYTEGMITAFGEVEVELNGDADAGTKFVLGGMYTTDSGIEYGSEYENSTEDHSDGVASQVSAFAQYSF